MPPKSLSDFAPELIVHIFKSLGSFEDIVSLNSTCDYFFNIWRTHTVSISDAVRPRFECYEDALELLQIQGKVTADGKLVISEEPCEKGELQLINGLNKIMSSEDRILHARQAALDLNKAFVLNASKIKVACADKILRFDYTSPRDVHAVYRVWILAEIKDCRARTLYLKSISEEELVETGNLGLSLREGHEFNALYHEWHAVKYSIRCEAMERTFNL